MGFVIVVVGAVYLLISIGVVAWAVSHAKKTGKSAKRWGWSAALVMWLIPFWDWLPTVAVHQYYCATESGFWVYKTIDQWKVENPRGWEELDEDKNAPMRRVGNDENHTDIQVLNQRFHWTTEKRRFVSLLPVYRWKDEIADSNTSQVVARYIDLSSGKGRDYLKFWMNVESCPGGEKNKNALYHFVELIVHGSEGEIK